MRKGWANAVAHRIGLGGEIEYTAARVGQTLHVPCAHGETVDFFVNARMPPEAVAKKMMQAGWTIGSKLLCPAHARKPKRSEPKAAPAIAAPSKPRNVRLDSPARTKVLEVLSQFDALGTAEIADLAMMKQNTVLWALRPLVAAGAVLRRGTPKKPTFALAKSEPAPKPEQPEGEVMSATVTPITDAPKPSAPTIAARRAAVEWLVEAFDADKGLYKAGVSDATIAKETGLAEAAVAEIRELNFGSLKEPSEIEFARAELNRLEQRIAEFEQSAAATVEQWRNDVAVHRQRLGALIAKNGWKQP